MRTICLYRPGDGRKLSGMIAGSPGVEVHEYSEVDQLTAILDRALRQVRR
jgi:hypothetical protein